MESNFYRYFHIKTDCLSNTWATVEIEQFIEKSGLFYTIHKGAYQSKYFFCSIQLMCVNDWNSWNNNNYNSKNTNYIDIIISNETSSECDYFLNQFSSYLGWRIIEETD